MGRLMVAAAFSRRLWLRLPPASRPTPADQEGDQPLPQRRELSKGMLFGLAGFALLSVGDAVIKSMAGVWAGTAVATLRFAIGAAGLGAILWWRDGRTGFAVPRLWLQIARGMALAGASLCFFLSIFVMPLADATAIQFINPMLTALVSWRLTGEQASARAMAATLAAFVGVVMVLRPNIADLGLVALLPLGAAMGMALLMTLNRMAANDTGAMAAQFWVALFAVPMLLLATLAGHFMGPSGLTVTVPAWHVVARVMLVAGTASCAHALIFAATTKASSAAIAPTVYIQIIVALALGIAVFGDMPDAVALAGTAIIVAAGIWLWASGRSDAAR